MVGMELNWWMQVPRHGKLEGTAAVEGVLSLILSFMREFSQGNALCCTGLLDRPTSHFAPRLDTEVRNVVGALTIGARCLHASVIIPVRRNFGGVDSSLL
jgi:hypothetical protein